MGQTTGIQWTDATWNPVRGCSRVSEGCRNCYAERLAARFCSPQKETTVPDSPFYGFVTKVNGHPAWTGKVELVERHLEDPLHWRDPRQVFVNSMSDLWHEQLMRMDIAMVYAVMAYCQWHTFQVLTKRPEERLRYCGLGSDVREMLQWLLDKHGPPPHPKPFKWPLPNVWEGVSVEDQATADERIPLLLQTPAALRFVSYEPALGPVDFNDSRDWLTANAVHRTSAMDGRLDEIDWIIVGGESGPGARPFDIQWARNAIEQCKAAGVACFVKQLGADPREQNDPAGKYPAFHHPLYLRDRKGGEMSEWPEDLRVRELPKTA